MIANVTNEKSGQKALVDLIVEYDDRTTLGEAVTPEELCRDHPELLPAVQSYLHRLPKLNQFLARPDPRIDLPRTLPGFSNFKFLGHGGMGEVFEATEDALRRTVAVKFARASSPLAKTRFLQEAQLLARLRHRNIVSVHAVGEYLNDPYFVMEYVPGGTLADRAGTILDAPRAVALMLPVAQAMGHAHRQGVIHRDLKPSNIMIDESGSPLVCDFGIATLREMPAETITVEHSTPLPLSLTRTGAKLGTPGYAAPELQNATGPATTASDIFSLGVILRELLTGVRGADEAVAFRIPFGLRPIIDRCVHPTPMLRYSAADDLARDLSAWQSRQQVKGLCYRGLRAALVLLPILMMIVVAAWPDSAATAYDRHTGKHLNALRDAGTVELIPATGAPAAYKVVLNAKTCDITVTPEGWFEITSPRIALVELLPKVLGDRFTVTGEIRQLAVTNGGHTGLYVGHSTAKAATCLEHHLTLACFSDRGTSNSSLNRATGRMENKLNLSHYVIGDRDIPLGAVDGRGYDLIWFPTLENAVKIPALDMPWRRVQIVSTPETVAASLNRYASASPNNRNAANDALRPRVDEPRGGLGIFINSCTVQVRNLHCTLNP